MGETDFSTQFQALCQKATDAHEKIKSASRRQETTEAAGRQGKAPDSAGQIGRPTPGTVRYRHGGGNSATGCAAIRRN